MEILAVSNKSTKSVLARLKIVRKVRSDADLAADLKISPQTLSSWKINDRVPYALCVETAEVSGVSLEWLLAGVGPMHHGIEESTVSSQVTTSPHEEAILALYRSLNESDQREIRSAAEEKKRIRDIEQRLEELTAALADVKKHA